MAGRVNKKFVITLSLGLAGVFVAVALVGVLLFKNSAADLAKQGDLKMAAKQYDKAQEYYSKAVNKEQTNTIYLEKWRESLRQLNPESIVVYRDLFENWFSATRQLARVKKDDVTAQREFLELMRSRGGGEFNRAEQESMISQADALIALHKGKTPGGEWETLKRFRGMAKFEIFNSVKDAKAQVGEEALADLLAAIAADPTDTESVLVLESFYLTSASRAAERSQIDQAKELEQKSLEVVEESVAKNPKDALIRLELIRRKIFAKQQAFMKSRTATSDINQWVKSLRDELTPELAKAMDGLRSSSESKFTMRLIEMLRSVETLLDTTGKLPLSEEAISLALAKRPSDAQFHAAMADLLVTREDLAGATASLQKILDLPMPATSLEGLRLFGMRNNARFLQALWSGRMALTATEANRPPLVATAKSLRDKLAAVEAPDSPQVQFVDAQIAFVDGDFGKANQLLDKHYKATRQRPNPDALVLQAQVAEKINQLGLAKERLDECLRVQPNKLPAIFALAEIEARLQNTARALELYTGLRQLIPDNKFVEERVALLSGISGVSGGKTPQVTDPVISDLIEMRAMMQPKSGEPDRSAEIIPFLKRRIEERKQDPRLVAQLAFRLLSEGNRDEALAAVKKGLTSHPSDSDLKDLEITLSNPDPVQARLKLVESKEAPAIDKALARYSIYRDAGMDQEADAAMAEAMKLSPDDARVNEMRFLDAIQAGKWDLAQQLTDAASKANLDDANGLTYRARMLGAQGKTEEGLAAITEAVGKGGALPEVWRIKGRLESGLGRVADAVESYRQALRLRPSDIGSLNDTINALVASGQSEEALKLAKESEKYGAGNERFMSAWLSLEAMVGSKRFAIERRELMAKSNPKDRDNLLSLASLYIADRDWIKSRPLIDRSRELSDGTDVLSLDAAWHWEQGEREKARTLFQNYIGKFEKDKITSYPHMIYAQFLSSHDDDQGALAALEQARAHQDPKLVEADKAIVEVHMKRGAFDESAAVCRRIITAGADTPNQLFRMRLVECLAKLGNFTDADTELKAMGTNIESDATTMLLAAEIKAGLNDTRGQKDLLDRAVTRFPKNALVFMKRGQALAGDVRTAREAISDFNKAIQLSPTMWQAYRLRGSAHLTLGQKNPEAYDDLTSAALLAPFNDELVYGLVADFIREDMLGRATDVATQVVAKRDRDIRAMTTFGSLFASASAFPEGARFYKLAFELEKNDAVAQRYLDCLLSARPPNTAEASQVLTTLGDQRIKASPGFLMAVAKLSMKLGRVNDANAAAGDALKLLQVNDPTMMLAWFNDLRRILEKPEDMLRYLEQTSKLAMAAKAQEWLTYFKVVTNLERKETTAKTLPEARALMNSAEESSIKQLLFRSVSGALFAQADYPEAFKVMREGLGLFPDDVELLNNGAFCLADKLDRAADAVPLIEKAVELTPAVADLWDTYGAVYMKMKDYEKASIGYRKSLLLSSTPKQVINSSIKLIDALLGAGRKDDARVIASDLQETMDDPKNAPNILEDMRQQFTEVKKRLDSAK